MRHPNRIIRALRKERNRLRQQVNANAKLYQSLTSSVQSYLGDTTPEGALSYVQFVESKNKRQKEQIHEQERTISRLMAREEDLECDRMVHVCIIAVLMLCVAGLAVKILFF